MKQLATADKIHALVNPRGGIAGAGLFDGHFDGDDYQWRSVVSTSADTDALTHAVK